MPYGITTITMTSKQFNSDEELANLINSYFRHLEADENDSVIPEKTINPKKNQNNGPEPATITGMALYLGFSSIAEFEHYEQQGSYAHILKRGRLRIEAYYEKKLHQQSAAGAIFALKSMGWKEKTELKTETAVPMTLKIEITDTGICLAAKEEDVVL